MTTETSTLPPHAPLDDPGYPEPAGTVAGPDTHGFTFADPDSRFAQEFAGAYQESLAQVRAAASEAPVHGNHESLPITEALDLADIRTQVDELTRPNEATAVATEHPATESHQTHSAASVEQLPLPQHASPLKRAAITSRQRAANVVYTYLGNKTPKFLRNHVPVYRAVSKDHAGYGNQWDVSEWTIGGGKSPRQHAMEWVRNHTYDPANPDTAHLQEADEYVAIQSTLGELERSGVPVVRHYGEYGSAQKKVVLHHANPAQPVAHRVIASNKRAV